MDNLPGIWDSLRRQPATSVIFDTRREVRPKCSGRRWQTSLSTPSRVHDGRAL